MACFQGDGKCPPTNERLNKLARYGATVSAYSLSSHVGSESDEHCFNGDFRMACNTSSMPTVWKLDSSGALQWPNSEGAALEVADLTPAILSP